MKHLKFGTEYIDLQCDDSVPYEDIVKEATSFCILNDANVRFRYFNDIITIDWTGAVMVGKAKSDTYFPNTTEAMQFAINDARRRKYGVFAEAKNYDWGYIAPGTHKQHSFDLIKPGKNECKEMLHITMYCMSSGTIELTYYIN